MAVVPALWSKSENVSGIVIILRNILFDLL